MNCSWFKNAKFGLFIHFGLYSALGGAWEGKPVPKTAEWLQHTLELPSAVYGKTAESFNPTDFSAREIVNLAVRLGMKYIVFTTKHHDGFAMYDSKVSDYNIVKQTPFGRDPFRELRQECDRAGIILCAYYSLGQDWENPHAYVANRSPDTEAVRQDFNIYLEEKCLPQLRELLTNYGKLGLIWFDGPVYCTPEQSQRVRDLVKSLQPDCLINGRIGNSCNDYFTTGDNMIPALPYDGLWESPGTLNSTWGYSQFDTAWKSPETLIRNLVKINSRGGNYLLNIGPDGQGRIQEKALALLDSVGSFMDTCGESIRDTVPCPVFPYDKPDTYFTCKDGAIFMHLFGDARRPGYFIGLNNRVKRVTCLTDGQEVSFSQRINRVENLAITIYDLPEKYRTEVDPVLRFELEGDLRLALQFEDADF